MKNTKQLLSVSGGVLGLVVVVCIAVAFNIILGALNLRKDLTEEKIYALSDGTREVLAELEQPVTLKFFFSSSNPEIPMAIKSFARRVEDLLVEYRMAGDGSVLVETYDPEPDSEAEEWAQKYGVTGQSMGYMGPTLYIGLVASAGDVDDVIPVLDPRQENMLEYEITRMISRVTDPEKPVVGVMSSLPVLGVERPPYAMPGQPPVEPQPAWFALQDLREDYELREIQTPTDAIDMDVDALLLIRPKGLKPQTLYAIDQFVLEGGSVVAFLDPLCVTELETQKQPPQQQFTERSSGLGPLLEQWGVTFDGKQVVADLEASSRLRTGQGNRVEESPVWLSLRRGHLNNDDILTAHLESVMMPYAGAFDVNTAEDVQVTRLLSTSETSARMDAMMAQFSVEGIRRRFRSSMTRLPLAVRLHGSFETAFPEGKPEAEEDTPGQPEPPLPEEEVAGEETDQGPAGLKESTEPATIVLVGDADMLYDRFCVQPMNFFGFEAHQPMNDNLAFLANAIEQLAGDTSLVRIRTRGKTDRAFDVVLELQRQAQEKYLAEERRLQERLEEAQRRLRELQSKKDDVQRFILSPQQQREIDNFREQVRKTKKDLKLVRRKLREDIERLGVWVKVINILAMPAVVTLAGIGFGLYRKRKTRQ